MVFQFLHTEKKITMVIW